MRKKTVRGARESAIASGWTVEGDPDVSEATARLAPSRSGAGTEAGPDPQTNPSEPGADPELSTRLDASEPEPHELADPDASGDVSNAVLVLLGVFGGLYLLYAWGWFIVAQAYSALNALTAAGSGSLGGVLQQIVFWAAPFAPPLWFLAALVLSRGGRTQRLATLLTVGAVVLLPLPMLIAKGG